MDKKLYLLLAIFFVVVFAQNTNAACTPPSDNLVPAANTYTTLCNNQTWQINDSDGFGIITLTAASGNATLDCNGTTIIGYGTGRGINTNIVTNVTIMNCNIYGYTRAFNIQATQNSTIFNNTGYNGTNGINIVAPVNYTTFDKNYFENFTAFGISGAVTNSIFKNNTGVNTVYGIWLATANNNIIRYNNYYNMSSACIRLQTSSGALVQNNNLSECVGQGITTDDSNYTNITMNNISDVYSLSTIGIDIKGVSGINNIISYNILNHYNHSQTYFAYGIRINNQSAMNNVIQNNTVTNYYENIQTLANNTNIEDNIVVNSSWNNIQFYSYYNKVNNNSITNYGHHGIDSHNQDAKNQTESGYSNVTNNIITMSGTPTYKGDASIFLTYTIRNNILSNNIMNLSNPSVSETSSMGLASEGGDYTYNNNFSNNNLNGVQGTCIYDDTYNNSYSNNMLLNCQSNYTITVFGSWNLPTNWTNSQFINNIASNLTFYFQQNNRSNISISQNSSFNIINGGATAINVTIKSVTNPFSDIRDNINNKYLFANIISANVSMNNGDSVSVLNGFCDTIPSNNMNITAGVSVLCSSTGNYGNINNIQFNANGYGGYISENTSNVTIIGSTGGAVFYFGVNSTNITINLTGMSAPFNSVKNDTTGETLALKVATYTFVLIPGTMIEVFSVSSTLTPCTTSTGGINSLLVFTGFFSIIVLVVVMGFVINAFVKGSLDAEMIKVAALVLVMTGILIGVGILILGGLASVSGCA